MPTEKSGTAKTTLAQPPLCGLLIVAVRGMPTVSPTPAQIINNWTR